jgi:hypothetical protein
VRGGDVMVRDDCVDMVRLDIRPSLQLQSTRTVSTTSWRTILQLISVVVAIEIALHSFIVKEPLFTMVGAALWVGGFFWTRRGGREGPALIGVLATWEILATLFLSEEFAEGTSVPAWILVVHFVSVAVALFTVVMTIVSERTGSRAQTLPGKHPREASSSLDRIGKPMVALILVWAGEPAAGEKAIAPLRAIGSPFADAVRPLPYLFIQSMLDGGAPHGRHYYWKSIVSPISTTKSSTS